MWMEKIASLPPNRNHRKAARLKNYRSQFSDIFKQGGNADQLIARVHELAANLRRQNEKITK